MISVSRADVDDVLVGQLVDDGPRDRQSPDAGIKDSDGRQRRIHNFGCPERAPALFSARALRSGADNRYAATTPATAPLK